MESILSLIENNLSLQISENDAKIFRKNLPTNIYGVKVKTIQLFQNLISNAIKFRREGIAPEIVITCEELDSEYKFCLKDNGVGIPKENRENVFELFQRAHGSKFEGSGIGLATCKRIVEQHRGKIWVDSDFEDGTIFCLTYSKNLQKRIDLDVQDQKKDIFLSMNN